jgi:predicted O-linked N-acetylglucosamine transferase (SPINDLY family)
VVSLAGQTAVSLAGRSILSNVGLSELVADTPEKYLEIATALATDAPRLVQVRSSLRQRMRTSPLMDPRSFASDIENAYRAMWRAWCAG